MPLDSFGRDIHYLRISLTDKCNMRCVYCMSEDMIFQPNDELMTTAEIRRLVQIFARLGVDKIRLTGGEPTVHPDLLTIVRDVRAANITRISMTTNGLRLTELAAPLKEAGLERVNVSVDTLDPDRFHRVTRWGHLDKVLAGVQAAEAAGLTPIKINAVIARGFNEQDVADLARLTLDHPWQVRFIEMMPFGDVATFAQNATVAQAEIMQRIEAEVGPLHPIAEGRLDGEARLYRLEGARAAVGFISTLTNPFCASCSRVRLTADGHLRLCLLRDDEGDLLTPLRRGASDAELEELIRSLIWRKPWGHGLPDGLIPLQRVMSQIGG
ncbi:MAG TPA: GTP 3',8-cyclase MoaA [Anaerolineae bacterium]|nr:GTP 3',8-cyclase MoaA [Anaerolineae bacterium]